MTSTIDPEDETTGKIMRVLLASELYSTMKLLRRFDGALQTNPEDAQVWILKADALKKLGEGAEARGSLCQSQGARI